MTDALGPFFDSIAGKRIAGGCPHCDAEQVLIEEIRGVWILTVAHDDSCPAHPRGANS